MGFDSKVVLAFGLDGLAGRNRRRRRRKLLAGLLLLILVSGFLLWRTGSLGYVRAWIDRGGRGVVSAPPEEMFRKMAFLPRPEREPAPDFVLRTFDGQNHSLSQHRGKVVLVNFWATWCPPCVREMPAMQRLYELLRERGLEIVAISLDQGNPDGVREFVSKLKITFPVIMDPDHEAKGNYRVRVLPTTYLVDREGRVVAWGMGAREWDGEAAHKLIVHFLDGRS